jgi:opacity protein-like surface antigen
MKTVPLLISLWLLPMSLFAQFEQKISVTLSGGIFSTFGSTTFMPDYGSSPEDEQPMQMSNYKPGPYLSAGIQYNLNRHISIQAHVTHMSSGNWFFDVWEGLNYTHWAIWDDVDDILLAEGDNEWSMNNVGIGLVPRYYLLPGKRINPFLFAGISLNLTSTEYVDREWEAFRDLGMLDPDDSGPDRANIEKNTGLGAYPGAGIEFTITENISIFIASGVYLVLLNEENFYVPEMKENLQAITVQGGLKFSFLKSKDI